MLRAYRLNPEFELDVNPINIIYIDIESEDEIKEKHGVHDCFFRRPPYYDPEYVYLDNYLVLQEKGENNKPTVSDFELLETIPGATIPETCTLSLRDIFDNASELQPGNYHQTFEFKDCIRATKPSKFVISIRSTLERGEKLTCDQNEALLCSISRYHPSLKINLMLVERNSEISRQHASTLTAKYQGFVKEEAINYKGQLIYPVNISRQDYPGTNCAMYPESECSELYYVHYSDNYIEVRAIEKVRTDQYMHEYLRADIYSLPPPLHSKLLMHTLFEKSPYRLRGIRNELFSVHHTIQESFRCMADFWPEGSTIPYFEELWERGIDRDDDESDD